ncbi:MAG: aldolase/citrate lyase family protein [Alphaproteobacteria bacterium]|jgi:4-hydroxy-2-oxoheptanedioate aldolase|nr:aldolase/citrate lyase family protein [Alphaproteobacteria bacterium]
MIMANTFKDKLAAGKPTIGTHFLSADPDMPEIIGDTGLFDYGEYCAEYSAFDMDRLYHMARAGQCAGLPLMIKLDQEGQGFWAQAALGAGFKSVLFTDIRSAEDVVTCHRLVRPDTPAAGGLMGVKLRRPALSGYAPETYLEDLESIVLLIMIEKALAVDAIDEVLAAAKDKGVDMTQWGPADFGFSKGQPGLMHSEEIRPFEELVIRKSIEYGVAPRIEIGEVEAAKRYIDLGVRHFCIGWDRFIYQAGLSRLGEGLRKLVEPL